MNAGEFNQVGIICEVYDQLKVGMLVETNGDNGNISSSFRKGIIKHLGENDFMFDIG